MISASAAETELILVSSDTTYLEDGSYIVTEIFVNPVQTLASTKSGMKSQHYYSPSKVHVFSVTVTGTFSYTGSSATATASTSTVNLYTTGATYVSKNAYTAGAVAVASGTVKYEGVKRTLTVQLTCSGNGTLS